MNEREQQDRDEQTAALRALLVTPFLDASEPSYALVRRHERSLAATLQSTFGYQLHIGSTAARASGPPTRAGLRRRLRIPPASASGRRRPCDEWAALGDRACLMLLLTLVALERCSAQSAITELARDVELAGADVDPPVQVDFRDRAERVAFADGLDLLCSWGILVHTAGSHESYARDEQDDDEALFTVDRRRLALLLHDPAGALAAGTLDELVDDSTRYPPTPEGDNRARFERLARRLVEDPVLLLADLDEDDRAYFTGQRARIEGAVATATGCQVERRAQGSALIVENREFTDVPFPTNSTVKQVALLLCDLLAGGEEISEAALRDEVHELVAKHGAHWSRDANDPPAITALAGAATEVLLACDLARLTDTGGLAPTALAARFRSPAVRVAGTPR